MIYEMYVQYEMYHVQPAGNKGFTQIYHRDFTIAFWDFSYEIGEKVSFRISSWGKNMFCCNMFCGLGRTPHEEENMFCGLGRTPSVA